MATSAFLIIVCCIIVVTHGFDWDTMTALDDYVNRDDGYYEWNYVSEIPGNGYTIYILNMTSQKWMDETVTTAPVWWHYLSIAIPDVITIHDAAHIFIEGGSVNDGIPDFDTVYRLQTIADFAVDTGAVAGLLRGVPNQPCFFTDTPFVPRYEDMIIARTWRYYIESNETFPSPDINLLLPMTKAGKLAMDTMVEFTAMVEPSLNLQWFMPTGFSKRGWVSWLLACVDQRIFATAPVVLDLLNWHDSLHHHWQAYGGWSWAFGPYWNEDLWKYLNHTRTAEIFEQHAIDALAYNERLTMPKLISSATGDEFFLLDDAHYYYEQLAPPKFLSIHENTDHSMGRPNTADLDANIRNFFMASYHGHVFPEITWTRNEGSTDGSIVLRTDQDPLEISAWWADTTNITCEEYNNQTGESPTCRRDFRMELADESNPIWWEEVPVEDMAGNVYRIQFDKRIEKGYRGFFIQMKFAGQRGGDELYFTSEVQILPDTFPWPIRCSTEEECRSVLK